MLNKDNEKIELTPEQQDPALAKPEDFVVISEIPISGQRGKSKAEYARLKAEADAKNRKATPDRNSVNNAAKPSTGSILE